MKITMSRRGLALRLSRLGALIALVLSTTSCAWTWAFHQRGATANCPTEIVSMDLVPEDFVLRERQRILSREHKIMLELVVEKHGSTLVLVGLHRMGQKAFKIVQKGGRVSVQTYWGRPAVRPINVLRDFHRVHFLALARLDATYSADAAVAYDGERSFVHAQERIREVWRAGHLERRIFERDVDGQQAVEIFFVKEDQVRIENARCGYRVEIMQSK